MALKDSVKDKEGGSLKKFICSHLTLGLLVEKWCIPGSCQTSTFLTLGGLSLKKGSKKEKEREKRGLWIGVCVFYLGRDVM